MGPYCYGTLLLWAHSFPTNADARGEAVRTMPRTLACYPHDRMTAGGSRAITKYITSGSTACLRRTRPWLWMRSGLK